MQAISSDSSTFGKCRCCLSEGYHQHRYDPGLFRKYLNIILIEEPQITMLMCESCVKFIHDVQMFRNVVLSSQKQLLSAIAQIGVSEPAELYMQNEIEIDLNQLVKVETELDHPEHVALGASETASPDTISECKDETSEFKLEFDSSQSDITGWDYDDDSKDIVKQVKIDYNENNSKDKRKRKTQDGRNTSTRKKRKKEDSESDTPIALIIEKNKKLKKKREMGLKSTKSLLTESRKQTFADNNKIRSNITLILNNSTIIPFRNNFKSTFKCFYCNRSYIPFKELREHVETEHINVSETAISNLVRSMQNLILSADISSIKCKMCEEQFMTIETLVEHLSSKHGKVYHQTDKKPSHGILGVDLSTDAIKCHICHKDFAFFKNLSVHMNDHYGTFVCYVCGKKFLSEHRYKCHEFKAHANKETQCKHCAKIFKTEPAMAYHVRKEHLSNRIKCLKCSETFPIGQYIKRLNHMAEVHGIQKPIFKCDTCGKQYANSGSLAAHKRYTHKRMRELRCDICGYITVHNTVMKKHLDFHNGVKNYECEFCNKRFGKPYTLKLHMKIHLNDKRFVCTVCDAAFIQKNSLKSHLKSRHPDSGIDISKL